jgi:predicted small secreted protein
MSSLIRKITGFAMVAALFVGGIAVGGCNTMEGAGKDIERAGDKIEDAAD